MARRFTKKVWVNGTFDVLHKGHINLLQYARKYGDVRVGIDFDERVKTLKGVSRPINTFVDRKYLLKSIIYVNSVVGFGSEDELINEIKKWDANIMVIGSDYKDKKIIGSHLFDEILYFDRVENYSTTNVIKKYNHNI